MKDRKDGTHIPRWLLAYVFGTAACVAAAVHPAPAAEVSSSAPNVAGAAGMTIYINPQTGALANTPAPGTVPLELTPEIRNGMSTSAEGLAEVPNPGPAGGFKVDLQGRFRSPLIVTIDANGNNHIQHFGEPVGSGGN